MSNEIKKDNEKKVVELNEEQLADVAGGRTKVIRTERPTDEKAGIKRR